MAAKKLKVFVYENDGKLHVYPPVIVLEVDGSTSPPSRDQFQLINNTNEPVRLDVWDGLTDPPGGGNPGGPKAIHEEVPALAATPGKSQVYPHGGKAMAITYTVTGRNTGRRAIANSDPVIIIDT